MVTVDTIKTKGGESRSEPPARTPDRPNAPDRSDGDQRVDLHEIPWDLYVAINDAAGEKPGCRMIYAQGSLTFLTTSRKHDWFAERLANLVQTLARKLKIPWQDAGQATYRSAEKDVGIEGDKTFYFNDHAVRMRGSVDIDLTVQPPPDLAIEVVVAHPADTAMRSWGRLGVPELWIHSPKRETFGIWLRDNEENYAEAPRSLAFPGLTSTELLDQMRKANEMDPSTWLDELEIWAEAFARKTAS
jgi:Uma2 family endonuclease